MKKIIVLLSILILSAYSVFGLIGHPASQIIGNSAFTGEQSFDNTVTLNSGLVLGNYALKPTCDGSTLGMIVFDTDNDKPYVCAGSSI